MQRVNQRLTRPRTASYFQSLFQESLSHTYRIKVKNIKDKQIAEFTYKLLNDLLICRHKLHKWGLIEDSKCLFCSKDETVEHVLFLCPQKFVMWKSVCMILNLKCELKHMYVSTRDEAVDWALSVFQFCIIKLHVSIMMGD